MDFTRQVQVTVSSSGTNRSGHGNWCLYMVRTRKGTLYTGITTDVDRRLAEHRGGSRLAARYLRANTPLELAYSVELGDRTVAARLEWAIKRLPKGKKEAIVAGAPDGAGLIARLGLD